MRASSMRDSSARPSPAGEWAPSSQRRASGVLLHVTSLPGRFGIGDLGPAARRWVELLAESHQAWWQMLPLTPTGAGHSPYTAFSAFAGNPLLISLEDLAEDGLLDPADLQPPRFPRDRVDYERVIPFKTALLTKAADRFFSRRRMRDAYAAFFAISTPAGSMTTPCSWPCARCSRSGPGRAGPATCAVISRLR